MLYHSVFMFFTLKSVTAGGTGIIFSAQMGVSGKHFPCQFYTIGSQNHDALRKHNCEMQHYASLYIHFVSAVS